jgi:hypothetical protein
MRSPDRTDARHSQASAGNGDAWLLDIVNQDDGEAMQGHAPKRVPLHFRDAVAELLAQTAAQNR